MSVLKDKRIFVTGAGGFLGKHVCSILQERAAVVIPNDMDLTDYGSGELPDGLDLIIHLAADVRGIAPNKAQPYRFLRRNMLMALEIIEQSHESRRGGVPIVAAGSVCAYCTKSPLPFNETDLWSGKPDENNLGYGMAKRFLGGALECAAKEYGQRYVHLISANLYGPGDHFEGVGGHVIPDLIRKIATAKAENAPQIDIWGTGQATRDFLYVEDAARAYVAAAEYLLEDDGTHGNTNLECNIGSGSEIYIWQLVSKLTWIMGYKGVVKFDYTRPDGQMRRRVESARAEYYLDWLPFVNIDMGLAETTQWYLENVAHVQPPA